MFQTMPSRPVPALVIPPVNGCIERVLPTSCGRSAFNHVCKGLETTPNGTGGSCCGQRKRSPQGPAMQAQTGLFAPCHDFGAALSLDLSLERIRSFVEGRFRGTWPAPGGAGGG